MTHHLMNLRHVPDDEAEEIRALFEAHEVRYYETPPSRWGISMGGFWVHDPDEAARAKALLAEYQRERFQNQRLTFEQEQQAGRVPGLWQRFRQRPATILAVCFAIAVILLLTVAPFVSL